VDDVVVPDFVDGVVLGLGGNIDDDDRILRRFSAARMAVSGWGAVTTSRVYRSAAVGANMPDFLNAAMLVAVDPSLEPSRLISMVLQLETRLGRTRDPSVRYPPRTIDIDVLLWGSRQISLEGPTQLTVPHPQLHHRRFAMLPCIDLMGAEFSPPGLTHKLGEFDQQQWHQVLSVTEYIF
jgi:2-amino-4-hydroxy-6-hydroxymethyldihydropteridine diphosphokinase